ncbi:MAG: BadF/BadG/BcrA/BcrD ATPase family protein [Candidatus Baltobacteraceae bacterium]
MKLYAGIDGGQSSTTAVIADGAGKILGAGRSGPADEVGADASSTRLRDALELAIDRALRAAGLFPDTEFAAVVAGVSGYNGSPVGLRPHVHTRNFQMLHDARVAHAAAFHAGEGILVIAGTGSVAFGVNELGEECRIGGWGYLFGDEGSAFWIGRRLIERAMRDQESGLRSPVTPPVLNYFSVRRLSEISDGFYAGQIDRAAVAALAKTAFELAEQGLDDARFIVEQAADAIAALAATCARRLHANRRVIGHPVPVALSGGLLQNGRFAARIHACLADRLPEATIAAVKNKPAEGALLLAYRADGIDPAPALRD